MKPTPSQTPSIHLLGPVEVRNANRTIRAFESRKGVALLGYLAQQRQPVARSRLAFLLWSDKSEAIGRRNLSRELSQLAALLPGAFETDYHTVALAPAYAAQVDTTRFAALARAGDPAALEAAVALYRDEFMAGLHLDGCPEFETWLLRERELWQREVSELLARLVAHHAERREHERAEHFARRWLALEPWQEEAHRALMLLLARSGRRAAALAQYEICRRTLAAELEIEPVAETTALAEHIRSGTLGPEHAARLPPAVGVPADLPRRADVLAELPAAGQIFGRHDELHTLRRWLIEERCRVVTILGIGGIGKTTLTARLVESLSERFERVVWRSLLNAPPPDEVLRGCAAAISGREDDPTAGLDERLDALIGLLRERRCLVVLDNSESILQTGGRAGTYRAGYEGYGQLLRRVAEGRGTSAIVLTSREQPLDLVLLEGEGYVRSLRLSGITSDAGSAMLRQRGLEAATADLQRLVERYSGNPLALRLVAATIADLFGGDVGAFLRGETLIFDDMRDVLDQHVARLSKLERELAFWLAIERVPVSVETLRANLAGRESLRDVVEAVRSLQRRLLIETQSDGVTLQNVVLEYVTDRLIAVAIRELEGGVLDVLVRHPLMKAQAKEYVRQSQARLILQPVADQLLARLGYDACIAALRRVPDRLRAANAPSGYAAGNILNLLVALGANLRGLDFGQLPVWQAYLPGVMLPEVNFSGADLSGSVFTNAFGATQPLAFSPDGWLLVTCGNNGAIHWHRADDGQILRVSTGHSLFVWSVAFSHDSALLASASEDHTVRIWDAATGCCRAILRGHTGWVKAVVWLPGRAVVASASGDETVRLWDVQRGECTTVLHTPGVSRRSIVAAPDGVRLASGGDDSAVQVWDLQTGQTLAMLRHHTDWVRAVAWSADGRLIASGGNDHTIGLWDAQTYALRGAIDYSAGMVWSLAFHPDSHLLASAGSDQIVRLWDVQTGQLVQSLHGHTSRALSVAFHPSGALLASSAQNQTVRLWNTTTGEIHAQLHSYTSWAENSTFSADGTLLVSTEDDSIVRVWDAATGARIHALKGHTSVVRAAAFSHAATQLASVSEDDTVRLWDVRSGRQERVLIAHTDSLAAVAWSRDDRLLASGGQDGCIHLWDAARGSLFLTLHAHGVVQTLAFDASGDLLISGARDGTICVWDLATGQPRHVLSEHASWIQVVASDPIGTMLASGGGDQRVRLWDIQSGHLRHTFNGHTGTVASVAFRPDGALLASGGYDQRVCIWEVQTGRLVGSLHGHTSWVRTVAWSADGTRVVSGSSDETIRTWDVANGACLGVIRAPGPYAGMHIAGITGLSEAQRDALKALGAVERFDL
jgi:WD40 repeat protein/DNA-binding SARP family transcriptional activator